MADGRPGNDPYGQARKLGYGLCMACIAFLVVSSVVVPGFHVDPFVFGTLALIAGALVAVDIRLFGGPR